MAKREKERKGRKIREKETNQKNRKRGVTGEKHNGLEKSGQEKSEKRTKRETIENRDPRPQTPYIFDQLSKCQNF